MPITKSVFRRAFPTSVRRLADSALASWKQRKFVNSRRAMRSVGQVDPEWRPRIDDAIACPDNSRLSRVPDAGQLVDGVLTMHNGIRVGGLGYCGAGMLNLLIENRGVHEPQEECAFNEVLPHVGEGSAMLELGAYWGFYSLWFAKSIRAAECHLLEPHRTNICSGQINFQLNDLQATFDQAYAGAGDGTACDGVPVVTVDTYCRRNNIDRLAILHADIQGAEVEMLNGAVRMLSSHKIDYLFISTHSNTLHYDCISFLKSQDYLILAAADLHETYSVDGLIVARGPHIPLPKQLAISKKMPKRPSQAA